MLKKIIFIILISTSLFIEARAAKSPWKPEDIINQETAQGFEISPDGSRAVWVKSGPEKEKDKRIRHLFLSNLDESGETLQLTRGQDSESSPFWSPSGKIIAFLSERKEGKEETEGSQVWFLNLRGGEPWKVTSLALGVIRYAWINDETLLLLAREPRTLRELKEKEKKDSSLVAEDQEHMTSQRLFLFDCKTKSLTRIADNADQITSFELSHDKKTVLTENNQSVRYEVDKKIKPKYFLVDIAGKTSVEIFPDPAFKPSSMAWAQDDKGFYFSVTRTSDIANGGPGAEFLYFYDLKTKSHEEVPLDWEWGLLDLGSSVRKDGFVVSLANGARPKWRRYTRTKSGYSHKDLEGKHCPHIYGLVLQEKGNTAIYQYSTASVPRQWFLGKLDRNVISSTKQITELNENLADKVLAKTEVLKWKGAMDEEIEGILYYPHEYKPGRRYPLFLSIHGGPAGVDMDVFDESWVSYPNILAQKGCFVLLPNYHGSGGYGQKFVESIKGHYYEYEVPDMLKGIDVLIAEGLVDPERLGAMGWSNGGILTIALSVWSDRFKVAGVGAADVNWTSDYGNCAFGVSFDKYYFKGAPWDELDHYLQKSPLFHLKEMKVPTIIFHGTEDTSVPYEQGWEYYRALQQIGKAPVRFIVFPGEPHSLSKLTHQLRKMEEELAWFDKHFFKIEQAANEALKEDSPLDVALKARTFARTGAKFGRIVKGRLIPETVRSGDIESGRFEVTRAQWAAFDTGFMYEAGTENYPATGMGFEKAREYAEWLKGLTGENLRLPTAKEAEGLAKKAGKSENTLDYWAGYAPNIDDAQRLLGKIKDLAGLASLLCPVDRFHPGSEEMLYGLGGNAAEWAVDEKGQGKVMGCSAVSRTSQDPYSPPPAEYIGLRIVKDISQDL